MEKELRGNFQTAERARKCKLLHIIGNRDGLPECHGPPETHGRQGFWRHSRDGPGISLRRSGREARIQHLKPGTFPASPWRGSLRSHFRKMPETVKINKGLVVLLCQTF